MALSVASNIVDERQRELIEHGTALFPVACYHDDLRWEEVVWHWHEEFEMIYVSEGCAYAETNTQQAVLRKGQGCLINGNVLHSQKNKNPGESCRFHSITFHPRLVGGSVESVFWEKYVWPLTENDAFKMIILSPEDPFQEQILRYIEQTWQSCVREDVYYEIGARYAFSTIFAMAQRLIPKEKGRPLKHETVREERMKAMLQYIRDNMENTMSVAQIAAAANVSESECLRSFREVTHTTPMRYVQQLRLQRAAQLLSETQLTVSMIGTACGFLDMSYFSGVFRRSYGQTPLQYRKQKQKRSIR